ncbi:phosphonate ABC transporter, permease protein PhnE [Natrarchaeobius sp. A-rgal3]|uniref:phosphonate ABC transporter, permease protein PhnE n=1 Tax=Natrarchaeobius versutus TaxID=1679078 RepID=UPI00350F0669
MSVESITWERHDRRARLFRFAFGLGSLIVVIASWQYLELDIRDFGGATAAFADLATRMFPPHVAYTPEIVSPLIETVHIAAVGTMVAFVLSIPVAYLSAENLTPNRLTYTLGKVIVTVSRSVHTIIWALFFVIMFGPGALAGAIAIAVRSVGFLGKLLGEELEEIDAGQQEAIAATGASRFKTLLYGVVPQIKPALVGLTIYRWDINVRGATILGFVGAGGIGVQLYTAVDSFAWRTVAIIVLAILLVVILSEGVSAYARTKVR